MWRLPTEEKVLYLTFDDGPIPEVTPWVLDQLDQYQAKATFFCVGENVVKHPAIYAEVLRRGHRTGNHTFNHLSGWSTVTKTYMENVRDCAAEVQSDLFRPPYGRLRPKQVKLLQKDYNIVMWDVLSGDFDTSISADQCWANVQEEVQPGSIVVFHDSLKAKDRLYGVLPRVLEYYKKNGYRFEVIG